MIMFAVYASLIIAGFGIGLIVGAASVRVRRARRRRRRVINHNTPNK